MMPTYRLVATVFLCSLSSLSYELVLTRIFSISLWYHFAFMIVSIAMLGIGASGTLLSLVPRLRDLANVPLYTLLAGVSISLSYLLSNQIPFDPVRLSWDRAQLLFISLYYVTLAVPFFFTGSIVAAAFSSLSGKSGLLYGGDLLGAGLGSAAVLVMLSHIGPEKVPFILSSVVLCTTILMGGARLRVVAVGLIALNVFTLFLKPEFIGLRMSPYKGLEAALRYPGAAHLRTFHGPFARIDTFLSPAVRYAPGLSLRYLDPLPEQIGVAVDGGDISAVTAAVRSSLSFLDYLPSTLPYKLAAHDDAVVLDPKGGLQSVVARHHGVRTVYAIESNAHLMDVIRRDLADFSGRIYEQNSRGQLGRSWLSGSGMTFDLIDISMTGSAPSAAFGIAEDYRYTVEAFRDYLGHLKPEGFLSMHLYILPPPRVELRLLATLIAAFEETGMSDVRAHLAAIRSVESITMVLKKSPLTGGDIDAVRAFCRDRRFDLLYLPGIREEETNRYVRMPSNEYFRLFQEMLDMDGRKKFLESYLFDVRPVRDDAPFFHFYLTLQNAAEIYRVMGEKWQYFIEEGYLLPAVFMQVLLLALLLITIPAMVRLRREGTTSSPSGGRGLLPYFAFLGIGYLFVEITIIQKMILTLETPSYAFATVLTSLLIASGAGSLMGQRSRSLRHPSMLLLLSLLIGATALSLAPTAQAIAHYHLPAKVALSFVLLLPLGFLMGLPFPAGMREVGGRNETLIPWAWSINGCFSVLSPLLAVMLAMVIGFRGVLWLGALCYVCAYLTLRRFLKRSGNV